MASGIVLATATMIISVILSGCGVATQQQHKQREYIYIPVSCPIPNIERVKLDQIQQEDDYNTVLNKLIRNYGLLKEENVRLWEIIEMCRRIGD